MFTVLAQQNNGDAASGIIGTFMGGFCCCGMPLTFIILFLVIPIIGWWKVFVKAGKPGWAAIVPVYNVVVLTQIAGKPDWWAVLFFVPFVNLAVMVILGMGVAKCFGCSDGFGVGLGLLPGIFYPILGFGKAKYLGPQAPPAGGLQPPRL